MTALLELGAFIGALLAGFFADRYSRRASIGESKRASTGRVANHPTHMDVALSASARTVHVRVQRQRTHLISPCLGLGLVWFVIGSIIQTTSFQFAQLVVGRFIGGVGIGLLSSTAPMYISEISPPNVRGAFLVLSDGAIVFGIVVMFYLVRVSSHLEPHWVQTECRGSRLPQQTYGTRYIASDWCFRLPFLIQITPGEHNPSNYKLTTQHSASLSRSTSCPSRRVGLREKVATKKRCTL